MGARRRWGKTKREPGESLLQRQKVAGRHGLGRRWEGGGGDHLSSMGRSLGRRDEGMSVDLEAVEEGGAPGWRL
jgi:hypothetical protein